MGQGLASFAAGFGSGYLGAKRQKELDGERQTDRAMRQQEFDARMGEVNEKKELKLSLADAARPGTANENGATLTMADGTKTTYDSADVAGSDFRQLRRADDATGNQTLASTVQPVGDAQPAQLSLSSALNKGTPAVPAAEGGSAKPSMGLADVRMPMAPQKTATMNGKAFGSLADAQTAATAHNAPAAKAERQAAAYDAAGQPDKASQIREMAQTVADKSWRRKIGIAMTQPGETALDGLATLFSESEFGPMAGKKVKAIPSADGKMVIINEVGEDGSLTPSTLTFSNDQSGAVTAAYMLDRTVTPEHRYTSHVADRKTAAQQAKDAAVFDETKRHNRATETNAATGQLLTDSRTRELNETKVEENRLKREAKDDTANLTKSGQIASFDTMLGTLDRLGKHPGLSRSVGAIGAFPTMPGSNSANFKAELNTFQSQAFIPMVSQLKGMGALSDAEGKKLTQAVGALDPSMGEKAFRESVSRITVEMGNARKRVLGSAANTGGASGSWDATGDKPQGAEKPAAPTESVNIDGVVMNATQALDGKFYVKQSNGKYAEVSD